MDPLVVRVAERYLLSSLTPEDLIRSLNGLIKSKGGQFSSDRQAKFLWQAAKSFAKAVPSFVELWAHRFHTGENSFSTLIMTFDPRFGRSDPTKIRYYAYAYVIDGAGVVAAAKVKIAHPKGGVGQAEPESIGETIFERKEPATPLYDHAEFERAEEEKVRKNKPMIDEIKKLPGYDDQEILQSFVQWLETGRPLTPGQLGVLRKFMPVEVGNVGEWKVMRDESFHLTEHKLVEPVLKFYNELLHKVKPEEKDGVEYMLKEVHDAWAEFKAAPKINFEVYHGMYANELAEVAGWKKPSGVTGFYDVLAKMDQLVKRGQKAPRTALKFVSVMQHFHTWLKSLSASAVVSGLEKKIPPDWIIGTTDEPSSFDAFK